MIIASYVLHYGKEYLAWSIRSIQDCVDEIQVFYSPKPSFGYQAEAPCPETEDELKREAYRFLTPGKKLHWVSGVWPMEGMHRDAAVSAAKARGATQVLVVDADEIWDPETLKSQLRLAALSGIYECHARFAHFWRSFGWVCKDPSMPLRIINLNGVRDNHWYADGSVVPVLHFGYAQSEKIIKYKLSIHGHRSEWRPEWLAEKFLAWTPGCEMVDVHPTCGWNSSFNDYFWTPKPTPDPLRDRLVALMSDHPYFNLEMIK